MSGTVENQQIKLYLSERIPSDKDNMDEYELLENTELSGFFYDWPEQDGNTWRLTVELLESGEEILNALLAENVTGSFLMFSQLERRYCIAKVTALDKLEYGRFSLTISVEAQPMKRI